MARDAHVAIDLGASSGRVMIGVHDGSRILLEEVHRFPNTVHRLPGGLHWDLLGLWTSVQEGVRKASERARDQGITIHSLGVDTWGVDYGLLGRSGEILGFPRCYRDPRNEAAFRETLAALGRETLYDVTGIQFMAINTLFQLVARQRAEPGLLDQAHRLLFMPDLFHHLLTGEASVESTIASTSQMIDARTSGWATEMLEEVGIPTHILGPLRPPGTVVGAVRPEVGEAIGLPGVAVIAPAAHDTAAAVAAVPADPGSSWCFLSSGTWSLLGAELEGPCLSARAREVPFTNEGGVGGTIRFLKNITGLWLVEQCREALGIEATAEQYDRLTELARQAAPFATLIDTDHPPFSTPGGMPKKIAEFSRATSQEAPSDPGGLVRCCLESLALTYRHTLEMLEEVLDRSYEVIHLVGGGARNQLLNQMTADATGRPVLVGPEEATALGNVLVQALGAGLVPDRETIRRKSGASFPTETFLPRDIAAWDRAYERFRAILGSAPHRG